MKQSLDTNRQLLTLVQKLAVKKPKDAAGQLENGTLCLATGIKRVSNGTVEIMKNERISGLDKLKVVLTQRDLLK